MGPQTDGLLVRRMITARPDLLASTGDTVGRYIHRLSPAALLDRAGVVAGVGADRAVGLATAEGAVLGIYGVEMV